MSILDGLSSDEFKQACADIAAELRAGAEISPEETAGRLGVPLDFLLICAAQFVANSTGRVMKIVPQAWRTRH